MLRACVLVFALLVVVGCGKKDDDRAGDPPRPVVPEPPAAGPKRDTDPKPKAPEETAAAVGAWVKVGNVRMRITKAEVKHVVGVNVVTSAKSVSTKPELTIRVEVQNLSAAKKVSYTRGGGLSGNGHKLTDEHGNRYGLVPRDEYDAAEGSLPTGVRDMRPGEEPLADVLCFERPVDAATELLLTLDSNELGEKQKFRFVLKASDWK